MSGSDDDEVFKSRTIGLIVSAKPPSSPELIAPPTVIRLFSILEVYSEDGTGFNTTATDQLTYNTWLAGQASLLTRCFVKGIQSIFPVSNED